MKKTFVLAAIIICSASASQAFDIKDALSKITSGKSSTISNVIESVLTTDNLEVSSLEGAWKYSEPAVTFKSDNLLQKAGGAAAAGVIEGKLEPIYNASGITNMTLDIDAEGNFTMTVKKIKLTGTIEKLTDENSQANFAFNFKASKIKIGKMDAYVQKSATGKMSIMFDISKLITIVKTVGSIANNSTINSAVKLLESYDGLCAGFALTK